jgi:chromosomal replication initiation ATPase DnaA
MSDIATLLRETEVKISELMSTPVALSITLMPHKQEFAKTNYEWLSPGAFGSAENSLLIKTVCEEFGMSKHQFVRTRKNGHSSKARQAYLYLGNKLLRMTYAQMSVHIGRERTTALNQLMRAQDLVKVNDPIADTIKLIENKFLTLNQ